MGQIPDMTKLPPDKAHLLSVYEPTGGAGVLIQAVAKMWGKSFTSLSLQPQFPTSKMGIRMFPTGHVKYKKNGIHQAQHMLPSRSSRRIVRREENKTKLISQGVSTVRRSP